MLEELTTILHNLFWETEDEGTLPHTFILWAGINLITKPDYNSRKQKTIDQCPSWTQTQQSHQQNISKWNPAILKRMIFHDQVGFITEIQGGFNTWKSINAVHHINTLKRKTYDPNDWCIKSIWHTTQEKNSQENRDRGDLPQPDKEHPQRNLMLTLHLWWKTMLSPRWGTMQGGPLWPLLFNKVLETRKNVTEYTSALLW